MKCLKYLFILLFVPYIVLAEECDVSKITITSIKQKSIEGNAEVIEEPTFQDRNINLNLKMYEVSDSITYDMTINNASQEDYMIDEDTFKTDSEYIEYSLKANDNTNVVKAHSSKDVLLIVTYKKEIEDSLLRNNKYNASNNLKLSLNTNEKEKALDIITTDNIKESVAPPDIKNPVTSISSMLLITFILLTTIIVTYILIKRKHKYTKYIIIILSITLIPTVYAICKTDIEVESNIEIEKRETLFDTIANISKEDNACVSKYEGKVTDQVDQTVQATNIYLNKCPDKRNVIFGGFCWQIVRTTETAGIKLLYNGEPKDGKCENTRGNHLGVIEQNNSSQNISDNYLYGSSYTYDTINKNFTLKDTFSATWSDSSFENLISKYTCKNLTGTCTTLYRINKYESSTNANISPYKIGNTDYTQIGDSSYNKEATSPAKAGYMYNKVYNYQTIWPIRESIGSNTYSYGSSYTDDGNGQYIINDPNIISIDNWAEDNSKITNKYICKNPTNNSCSDIWYVTGTQANYKYFNYFKSSNKYIFSSDFNYSNGVYTSSGDVKEFWNLADENYAIELNTHHYTCWNNTGTCSRISYIYNYNGLNKTSHYINLSDGNNISNALEEMLHSNEVNRYNSNIKGIVDSWYGNYLQDYTDSLEDTVYCNRRVIRKISGWNPNGGNVKDYMLFGGDNDLVCENITDQFSINNSKAKLNYPVGLLQTNEVKLINNSSLMKTGYMYKSITPNSFHHTNQILVEKIRENGTTAPFNAYAITGVRPVISLKSDKKISRGTGSEIEPWIIE